MAIRSFRLAVLVAVALAAAFGCTRQARETPRIGFLSSVPSTISEGLKVGLGEVGLVEGRDVVVEWRWTAGRTERVTALAAELVASKPSLIVTTSGEPTAAVKAATGTIPIVFVAVGDPVRTGLVASLAHPGGNVTGLSNLVSHGFSGKMVELLKTAVPHASRIGVVFNPTNADHPPVVTADLPTAFRRLGLVLVPIEVDAAEKLEAAFEQAVRGRVDALLVLGDPVIYVNRVKIAELAAARRLPAMYFFRENVDAGGLMSYGPSLYDLGRRAAQYVDKILKGAHPGDLAIGQPEKFDLCLNRGTAQALGLTFPAALLQQAEKCVE